MKKGFVDPSRVYMSLLSAYNLYIDTGNRVKTASCNNAILLNHMNSGEEYYCVRLRNRGFNDSISKWREIINNPAQKSFFWPVDIISVPDRETGCVWMNLVYPCRAVPLVVSFSDLASNSEYIGVESAKAKLLAINIADAFADFYNHSYLYSVWDNSNFFVDIKYNSIMAVFSDVTDILSQDKRTEIVMEDYFTEYTDPYGYNNGFKYDFFSEMYSLVAMLFRILIGRYPYEGSLMDGKQKESELEIFQWKKEYVSHPIFIFDAHDKRNSIGDFDHEKIFLNRWNCLSDELRRMFSEIFQEENVLRKNDSVIFYTPHDWGNALRKL